MAFCHYSFIFCTSWAWHRCIAGRLHQQSGLWCVCAQAVGWIIKSMACAQIDAEGDRTVLSDKIAENKACAVWTSSRRQMRRACLFHLFYAASHATHSRAQDVVANDNSSGALAPPRTFFLSTAAPRACIMTSATRGYAYRCATAQLAWRRRGNIWRLANGETGTKYQPATSKAERLNKAADVKRWRR